MTGRRTSRRQFLAAAGAAALCGCGSAQEGEDRPQTPAPTRTTATRTERPTVTATETETATVTTRPPERPRFEPGPATCTVGGAAPEHKTWPRAGYDAAGTRSPAAAAAPNSLPVRTEWTVPTAATGPVLVDGDRYYLRTRTALLALNPADGRVRWRRRAPGPAGGVAVGDDVVALPTADGELLALAPGDGSEQWRVDGAPVATSPPLLTRDAVVLGTTAGIRAYARDDGTACFRVPTGDPVTRLVRVDGAVVGATARPSDGTLVAVDPEADALRYTRFLAGPPTGLLAADGDLVVGAGDDALGLDPDDGTPRWTAGVGPVVAAGRHRYALGDGRVVALDETGTVVWRTDCPAPTGVAATEDVVVATGETGDAALQVHDARTGRLRFRRREASGSGYWHPVVADDRLLAVGAERTYVLGEAL